METHQILSKPALGCEKYSLEVKSQIFFKY